METIETTASEGTLTILFTDLEGSTDLRVRLGDDAANKVIRRHDELLRSELEQGGGFELKALGDGFMALFTTARKAIETAISIQLAVAEHNRSEQDTPISVRIGLNSGDVSREAGDAHGTPVHAASRISEKAQGGQILISQIAHDLAGRLPETRIVDRGLFWLKGFPDRWRLFEVLWRDWEESQPERGQMRGVSRPLQDLEFPRAESPVVGRQDEQVAIREQLAEVEASGMRAVVLQGEAGIGKTRMLEAAAEMAADQDPPYWVLNVGADEELRGPFLLFRTLLTSPRTLAIAHEAMALERLDRAQDAISGSARDEGLSPQERMMRTFDEVTSAVSALTRERPVALLFDDLQWADEDSIQLIRYLIRTLASAPILVLVTVRPYSDSTSPQAANLVTDLDRLHATRVLKLQRLNKHETAELLHNLLGSPVDESTLDSLQARSEGVPFFVEEFARAYREAAALQLIDGIWTMTRLSGPTVPSSVKSLVERRLAQLPEDSRSLVSDAAILGRRFRLDDLSMVLGEIASGSGTPPTGQLADDLNPAVELGILVPISDSSDYDYSFSHDQIRAALFDFSSVERQRSIHKALADFLSDAEDTSSLSMLAYHSLKAGEEETAVASAMRAAQRAIAVSAPEESIRLVDAALSVASAPEERIAMLRIKDEALKLLDRGVERLANIAEMDALTRAVDTPSLAYEVKLRRASAARMTRDFGTALRIANEVRGKAHENGLAEIELEACLELGQAVTRSPLGEGYWPLVEVDLDSAEEPFNRALELSRELGQRAMEAAILRELAVLEGGRVRLEARSAQEGGASISQIFGIAPERFSRSKELAEQAFRIYEEIGDQRGSMSALISLAYTHVTDPSPRGMAGRLEHIRNLHHKKQGSITESQRAFDDAKMLYSIHVYARDNVHPDLALKRGSQAFDKARAIGNRWLECLAAGGVALTYVNLGQLDQAHAWIERASAAALAAPSVALGCRLDLWRGILSAARSDIDGVVEHFERAATSAGQQNLGRRCDALSRLAFESAKYGLLNESNEALDQADKAVDLTLRATKPLLPKVPWDAKAHAARSLVAQARAGEQAAAESARTALTFLEPQVYRTHSLDVLWAVGRTLIRRDEPEAEDLTTQISNSLEYIDSVIIDLEIKSHWFGQPMHRELAEMVGFEPDLDSPDTKMARIDLTQSEVELLRQFSSGVDDEHMAGVAETGDDQAEMAVSQLLDKLGVESRSEAVAVAIKDGIVWA